MSKKHQGLRLTLPGAPDTPHRVIGVPGFFRADSPTLVGDGCPVGADWAKELSGDAGTHLELVDVPASDVDALRQQADTDAKAAREGLIAARNSGPEGAEIEQLKDETAALSGKEN